MIAAVMATRFERPQREPLLETLRADGVRVSVIHDEVPHAPDWSLYRLWNLGVAEAVRDGAEYVCVLNDDVTILPGTLAEMAECLSEDAALGVVYPDHRRSIAGRRAEWARGVVRGGVPTPTTGTWGAGGMTGFCFMFRSDIGIVFDESYRFWYGDDQFEQDVRDKGLLVARIDGLPIDHVGNGSAIQVWDEMSPLMAHDRDLWNARQAVTA